MAGSALLKPALPRTRERLGQTNHYTILAFKLKCFYVERIDILASKEGGGQLGPVDVNVDRSRVRVTLT